MAPKEYLKSNELFLERELLNYLFSREQTVTPEASLVFEGDYTQFKHGGRLEQGRQFQVYYSDRRLDVSNGFRLYAAAQFKLNTEAYEIQQLTDHAHSCYITDFDIPEDAEEVIMWFFAEKGNERHYDSNFGANYNFPLFRRLVSH